MAANLAFSDVQDALKVMCDDSSIDQAVKNHPHLAMIDREEDFYEYKRKLPCHVGNPQGVSTSFATAQTNATSQKPYTFELTKVSLYAAPQIGGEAVEAAQSGNIATFLKDTANIVDRVKETMIGHIGMSGFRSAAGVVGRNSSGTASPITLTFPEDTHCLEIGMIITASPNADMSSPRTGTGTITAIARDTGIVTFSGTITSLAATDYIAVSGLTAGASGLPGWAPSSAPGATTFFGIDRTAHERLAGRRVDCTTTGPEECWGKVNAVVQTMAVKPDVFFLNPMDLAGFETAVAGQKVVDGIKGRKYDFGFDYLLAYGRKLVGDPDCPRGYAFGVPLDHWKMYSAGPAPKVLDADGNVLLRLATADDYEARVGARYNFGTVTPFGLISVALPT